MTSGVGSHGSWVSAPGCTHARRSPHPGGAAGRALHRQRRVLPGRRRLAAAPRQPGGPEHRRRNPRADLRDGVLGARRPDPLVGGPRDDRPRRRAHRAARLAFGDPGRHRRYGPGPDRPRALRRALLPAGSGPVACAGTGHPRFRGRDRRRTGGLHRALGGPDRGDPGADRGPGPARAEPAPGGGHPPPPRGGQPPGPLTGVANRRAWEDEARRNLARAHRTGEPLSFAILDLDQFKLVNDREGPGAGDALLCELTAGWSRRLRGADLLGRYGGDEFVLCLPDTDEAGAWQGLRQLDETHDFPWSAGGATAGPDDTLSTVLGRADGNLYQQKRTGRRA